MSNQQEIYPLFICTLSQGITEVALEEDIKKELVENHNNAHCDYQCVGVIHQEALLLAKTEQDRTVLRQIKLKNSSFSECQLFTPASHLIHEFKQRYKKLHHQELHLRYNEHQIRHKKQQIEGAQDDNLLDQPGHQREGHTQNEVQNETNGIDDDIKEEEMQKIKSLETEEKEKQRREQHQRQQKERHQKQQQQQQEKESYPHILHDDAPWKDDGVYNEFDTMSSNDAQTFYIITAESPMVFNRTISEQIESCFQLLDSKQKVHNIMDRFEVDFNKWSIKYYDNGNTLSLRRTNTLNGTLVKYGRIEFNGFYGLKQGSGQCFIYDRKHGYHYNPLKHPERVIDIGTEVTFMLFHNKYKDKRCHIFDHKGVSHDFIAFDVKQEDIGNSENVDYNIIQHKANDNINIKEEKEDEKYMIERETEKDAHYITKNANYIDIAAVDPSCSLIDEYTYEKHYYYDSKIFEGICISKVRRDNQYVGEIRAYPYFEMKPEGLTLLFHSAFFFKPEALEFLHVGTALNFSIGFHKANNNFIAYDIGISSMGLRAPPKSRIINRDCVGRIIVSLPDSAWVCNIKTDVMTQIVIKDYNQYKVNGYGRYNETERVNECGEKEKFCTDFVSIVKHSETPVFCNKPKVFQMGEIMGISSKLDQKYKFIKIPSWVNDDYQDIFVIIQTAEMYINAFLNSGSGGIVYFGVDDDGRIVGEKGLNSVRREFIRIELAERLKRFKPPVPNQYYRISFRQIVDNGFEMPEAYVIVVVVGEVKRNVKQIYYTQHQIYYNKPEVSFNYDADDQAMPIQCSPVSECWEWQTSTT